MGYYRPKPLYAHILTWQDWLPEYRQLMIEVQDMYEENRVLGYVPWNKYQRYPKTYRTSKSFLH